MRAAFCSQPLAAGLDSSSVAVSALQGGKHLATATATSCAKGIAPGKQYALAVQVHSSTKLVMSVLQRICNGAMGFSSNSAALSWVREQARVVPITASYLLLHLALPSLSQHHRHAGPLQPTALVWWEWGLQQSIPLSIYSTSCYVSQTLRPMPMQAGYTVLAHATFTHTLNMSRKASSHMQGSCLNPQPMPISAPVVIKEAK